MNDPFEDAGDYSRTEPLRLSVPEAASGRRLDQVLAELLPQHSRNRLQGWVKDGCVLVDGELSLVGTVNLDMRSLWLNFEITLAIDDKGFGADLAAVQDDYISRSRLLDARLWLKRPLWQRVAERLFYFFSPLL